MAADASTFQLDQLLGLDPVPDLIGNPNMQMIDFLNFDECESGAESSPQTISDNHTPSPAAFPSPPPASFQIDGFSFDFGAEDTSKQAPFAFGGPVTMGDVQVKEEPVELAPPVVNQAPNDVPPLAGLPSAQQEALQQLLSSFANYQSQFGLDVTASAINPSLLSTSAGSSPAPFPTPATETSSSSSAPATVPATVSAPFTQPTSTPSVAAPTTMAESQEDVDEPLRSIYSLPPSTFSPSEAGPSRSTRAGSTMSSAEDIDGRIEKLVPLSSIFSAGRGKGGKKGGGMSSVVRGDDEELDDDESWRPSPEEYKKLSSKEKRQLRNKLSARAFRTRRKDYIGTLESHIKDRDSVIDAIRAELSTSRAENQDLRRELEALKASTMSILHPESADKVGQSPAMLKALESTDLAEAAASQRRPEPINPINTRKDVSAFDRRGFWAGTNDNIMGGGSTICHTLLTPEFTLPPQPNVNPMLNMATTSHPLSLTDGGDGRDIDSATFADWAADTPFSLRNVDAYRMQLWSRLSRAAAADKAGLAPEMRPKFLVEPKDKDEGSQTGLALAAAAAGAQHIANRLTSSFWSAFSGSSSKVDSDKLAAVVTGKARLAVVPEVREKAPSRASDTSPEALAHAMAGLKVATGTSSPKESLRVRENPLGGLAGLFKPSPLAART